MKLVVQIPCLDEEHTLPATIADLPARIPGIDSIEILVIDDGSTDRTRETALRLGAHVVSFERTLGLGRAFARGLEEALDLGADVIVNTDGDNQYPGAAIERLVRPILDRRADLVVGVRDIHGNPDFSRLKKPLQRLGSWVVRLASGSPVSDATSGFRAFSRSAASRITLQSDFSHTIETLVQAAQQRLIVAQVPIRTNRKTRDSRLFRSTPEFIARSLWALTRAVLRARPRAAFLAGVAAIVCAAGLALGVSPPAFRPAVAAAGLGTIVAWGLVILIDAAEAQRVILADLAARARGRARRSARGRPVAGTVFPIRIDRREESADDQAPVAHFRRVAD